jgi:hypothetical protein
MLKFTDVSTMVEKKISRNIIMAEIFTLCQELANSEIKMHEIVKEYYGNQKNLLKQINEIEQLQCSEYCVNRQEQIGKMMQSIGNLKLLKVSDIITEITGIKEKIKNKTHIMKQIQDLIPKEGIATNYTIQTVNTTQTCASAAKMT